jgi:hypothetical protein
MKTYQNFASVLNRLLAGKQAVRLHVDGYMPLVVEQIGRSGDGRPLIALSHTAVQNGDLMRDPEVVFELHELGAEPITFRNDFLGILQDVYDYDDSGRRTRVYPRRKQDLRSFSSTWFRNLRAQGFLDDARTRREVLA